MKNFKSIIIVKYAPDIVWNIIRDQLPELATYISDVDEIEVKNRSETPCGKVMIENLWKANIKIPSILKSIIKPKALCWTDKAEWNQDKLLCNWQIQPHFFKERISCSGSTLYSPAMGGRGTKICFTGNLDISSQNLKGVPKKLEGKISDIAESLVSSIIPTNFRKMTEAIQLMINKTN